MAFTKNFTDASGNNYTPAFWRATQINIAAIEQNINLVFYAYKDAAAFTAKMQPLSGGVKFYSISGADFAAIALAAPVGATLYDVLAHSSEAFALQHLDVDSGRKDASNLPIMISYFDGAIQV